jgi:hypothetical protein
MSSQIQQILNILVDYPGNLVYHLILTFSITGAWYLALSQGLHSRRARRLALGLSLLLAIRIVLFLGAAAAWPGLLDGYLLPPLDRALTLLSLVIIVWLWAFSEPQPSADAATILLGVLSLTLLAMALVFWSEQRIFGTKFNGSRLIPAARAIALLLAGSWLVLIRPMSWGFGLGMLVVLLAGHALYLALTLRGPTLPGDYAGPVRLFELAGFALLLALPLRVPLPEPEPAPAPGTVERRRYAADLQLVRSLLALVGEDSGPVCESLTRAVASVMVADVCLLATYGGEAGQVSIDAAMTLSGRSRWKGPFFQMRTSGHRMVLRLGQPARQPARLPDLSHLALAMWLERRQLPGRPVTAAEATRWPRSSCSPHSNRAWDAPTRRRRRGSPPAGTALATKRCTSEGAGRGDRRSPVSAGGAVRQRGCRAGARAGPGGAARPPGPGEEPDRPGQCAGGSAAGRRAGSGDAGKAAAYA